MTPKERAEELIAKFNLVVLDTALGGSNRRVKQCALIAVDELLMFTAHCDRTIYDYLRQVKKEIETL